MPRTYQRGLLIFVGHSTGIHSPFPSEVLSNDGNEPLETSENSTVNDHRPCRGFIGTLGILGRTILQVKTFRELEIELDRSALEGPPERISDGNVDFGSVECTIPGVDFPFAGVLLIECFFQLLHITIRTEQLRLSRPRGDISPLQLGPKSRSYPNSYQVA